MTIHQPITEGVSEIKVIGSTLLVTCWHRDPHTWSGTSARKMILLLDKITSSNSLMYDVNVVESSGRRSRRLYESTMIGSFDASPSNLLRLQVACIRSGIVYTVMD